MSIQVSKSQFKAKTQKFFRQVETSGDSVVITDCGRPVLEVRPYKPQDREPLEVLRGSVLRFDHPTAPVSDAWEGLP